MAGVAPDAPGRSIFQATFFVVLHSEGRFFSGLVPLPLGPRQEGQFEAAAWGEVSKAASRSPEKISRWFFFMSVFRFLEGVDRMPFTSWLLFCYTPQRNESSCFPLYS